MIFTAIIAVFSLGYLLFHLMIRRGLYSRPPEKTVSWGKLVSIIVAARDEEQHITFCLGSLLKQTYPREFMEIIVIDDHSSDRTGEFARACAAKFSKITVLDAPPVEPGQSPKKAALAAGIAHAHGDFLLFTDADCAAPPKWVELIVRAFESDADVIASWVLPLEDNSLPAQIELIDTLALQLIGASAMQQNHPFLGNGANLAYRRRVYFRAGGFQGISSLGSGDDDLLLQKLGTHKDVRCRFLFDAEAAVTTGVNSSWENFFEQRIRWGSKIRAYPGTLRLLEFSVFCYYLLLWLPIPMAIFSLSPWWLFLPALGLKLLLDGLLIRRGLLAVARPFAWPYFILASALHLLYIPVIGIVSLRGRFTWKGREYRKGELISR
jgi:cellulose synthase/poly-beta-1,6-N-acetylglucosamine synthase-like glycosyltransferase